MNDRFKQSEEPIEMPDDDIGKANLAHKLITEDMVRQGMPLVIATAAACALVQQVLDETRYLKEAAQRHFGMMSVEHMS
jgi:hypothetical protein